MDEDICSLDQLEERLACRRPLQVECHALLVAVDVEKIGAHAGMARRTERTNWVALGWFDLDHVRPHVPEDLRRYRPQYRAGQIDDADSRKRSGHFVAHPLD
jgi:hypothetical protein